jgi:hypothetical protein
VNALRTAQVALVLSAVTLAVVLFVAVRPTPPPEPSVPEASVAPVDTSALTAEIEDLRVDITTLQQSVVDTQSLVRAVLERGGSTGGSPVPGTSDALTRQLDRLEASITAATAKVDAICGAIESSAFAPSGFNCP